MRPEAILKLLKSVENQELYPDEIVIVDGSKDNKTKQVFEKHVFKNLTYFKVDDANRGLTKQRNFGISKIASNTDIISFLDDDTFLKPNYFKNLKNVFLCNPNITGVGGIAVNENTWKVKTQPDTYYNQKKHLIIDGFVNKLGQRHVLRNYLGLGSNQLPGIMPEFSNGLSCGYPLTGKFYEVDLLVGMSMSFRRIVVDNIKFSNFFEGYGLYEDADFSIRAQKFGKNVLASNVLLEHNHAPSGRPNAFKYGKMVIKNGWYVWRVKYRNPSIMTRIKWNSITFFLMILRFINVFTTAKKTEAFTETLGRFYGLLTLIFNKPKLKK